MTWRKWHLNWYHGVGETVFKIYSSACNYLGYCGNTYNSSELTPIFIEDPGDPETWEEHLPPAASALRCLYPSQAFWIQDEAIQNKVDVFVCCSFLFLFCMGQSGSSGMVQADKALDCSKIT